MTWAGELLSGQQQRADADCPLRALSSLAWEASTFTMECEGLEQEGVFRQPASPLLPPPHPPHLTHLHSAGAGRMLQAEELSLDTAPRGTGQRMKGTGGGAPNRRDMYKEGVLGCKTRRGNALLCIM